MHCKNNPQQGGISPTLIKFASDVNGGEECCKDISPPTPLRSNTSYFELIA